MAKGPEIWKAPIYVTDGGQTVKVGETTLEYYKGAVKVLGTVREISAEKWEGYKSRFSANLSRMMSNA